MAKKEYCSNVSTELEEWSEKLHKLSSKIDRISTGDKYRVFPQIEEFHMILTELDDRLCSFMQSCKTTDVGGDRVDISNIVYAENFNWKGPEQFDYDFGG
jgi:hypothetical protein